MRSRTTRTATPRLLGAVVGLVALAGCGSDDVAVEATSSPPPPPISPPISSSTPTPTPAAEGSARSLPGADYVVPSVSEPLEVAAAVDAPCGLLDTDQQAELQLGTGTPTGDGSCRWPVGDGAVSVLVAGIRTTPLASFYDSYVDGGDGSWEPTTVAALPAALVNGPFEASTGSCILVVAVSDDALLRVERGTTPDQATACDAATAAAGLAIATLRGAR